MISTTFPSKQAEQNKLVWIDNFFHLLHGGGGKISHLLHKKLKVWLKKIPKKLVYWEVQSSHQFLRDSCQDIVRQSSGNQESFFEKALLHGLGDWKTFQSSRYQNITRNLTSVIFRKTRYTFAMHIATQHVALNFNFEFYCLENWLTSGYVRCSNNRFFHFISNYGHKWNYWSERHKNRKKLRMLGQKIGS